MGKTILILGGGPGGVVAANVLAKVLPKEHRIALIDRNENHLFLASLPLVMIGKRKPSQITRSLRKLESRNIQFIQAEVEGFNPHEKTIQTDLGALSYDSLVIALGAEQQGLPGYSLAMNPYSLQGALQLQTELSRFRQGHIVLFVSSLPFTGAIAPYEIVLLLDAYFRQRGLRKKVQISLVTPEDRLLSMASPRHSARLAEILTKRQIRMHTSTEAQSLSQDRSLTLHPGDITGDLFLGIPHHLGPAPLRHSPVADPQGWIKVDPHTLATCCPDVYAVGDATGIVSVNGAWIPKVGFFAHYQAEVVARNLALCYANKESRFRFVGSASGASMLSGYNRGCFVSIQAYANPPTGSLSTPNRAAFWTKALFEKYWLSRWF